MPSWRSWTACRTRWSAAGPVIRKTRRRFSKNRWFDGRDDQRTASRRWAVAKAPSNFRKCWIRPGCWAPNFRSGWRGCGRAGPGPSKDRMRKLDSHTVPSARRTTIRRRCRTSRWDNCQVMAPLLNQCKWLFVQPFLNWKLLRIDSRYFIKM